MVRKRDGFEEDPGFNIFLEAPKFAGNKVVDLRDELIKGGWGTLKAHIREDHHAVVHLDAMGIGKKNIISSKKFENLNDIKLKVGIIPDVKSQMRNTQILSKGTLNEILPKWGGRSSSP